MFENDEWRIIEEFPQYLVSSHGRIKHKDRINARKVTMDPHWRLTIVLRNSETGTLYTRQVNRLVAHAFLPAPPRPELNSIVHIDGETTNCHYENLRWVTRPQAIEWNRMHRTGEPQFKTPPVKNNFTGVEYENAYECAMVEGKLESEIVYAIENRMRGLWDKDKEYCYIPINEYFEPQR